MREIVLDTETTGLDPLTGDRVIEIGCVELFNHVPTEKFFHAYINPERDVPMGAYQVHGISTEFLSDKPVFSQIVGDLMEFIGGDTLVIHNADFDMRFLNHEFRLLGYQAISNPIVDTLKLARKKFPGAQVNLDALCRRFAVDNSGREKHGALLDSELLAEVYMELLGGKQVALGFQGGAQDQKLGENIVAAERVFREPRPHDPHAEELAVHEEFIQNLKKPIWNN